MAVVGVQRLLFSPTLGLGDAAPPGTLAKAAGLGRASGENRQDFTVTKMIWLQSSTSTVKVGIH